jgi:hypothetical protein
MGDLPVYACPGVQPGMLRGATKSLVRLAGAWFLRAHRDFAGRTTASDRTGGRAASSVWASNPLLARRIH